MDYKDTIKFLYSLYRHGIKLGLESISLVLQGLGNPHHRYQTFHVGGTNGKGSTSAILAKVLQASGQRVGLYTSPHLVDFRERIRVNGQLISETQVIQLTQQVQAASPFPLTFFEFTTAMAFQYFSEQSVDIAVVEVGMGGRFDATNVVTPQGVIITSIAHDHEAYLGRTLAEIAFEKAGIIKQGIPVIIGEMPIEAETVIREIATTKQAPCYGLGSSFQVVEESVERFRYDGFDQQYSNLSCSLLGWHQKKNVGCAIALLEQVGIKRLGVQESVIRSVLSRMVWEGRFETLERHPRLIVDGAHNPEAAKALCDTLLPLLTEGEVRLIMVVGMMRDKDRSRFLEVVCPLASHVILTEVSVLRAATIAELRQSMPVGSFTVHESPQPAEALQLAKQLAKSSDIICATGSLFLAGEVRSLVRASQNSTA